MAASDSVPAEGFDFAPLVPITSVFGFEGHPAVEQRTILVERTSDILAVFSYKPPRPPKRFSRTAIPAPQSAQGGINPFFHAIHEFWIFRLREYVL